MDKCQFAKRAVGLICATILVGTAVQSGGLFGLQGAQTTIVHAQEQAQTGEGIVNEIRQGTRGPIYGGYFRTWHDESATDKKNNLPMNRPNSMAEVPKEVDILFVFDNHVHENSPLWTVLREKYVPKLHNQGTAVVQTIGVKELTGKEGLSKLYPNTEKGNKELAAAIVKKYITDRNLDGLDIDVEVHDYDIKERYSTKEEVERAAAVFQELAQLIGKNGKDKTKLLIMDTTLNVESNPLFVKVASSLDLLLRQYYGPQGANDERIEKEGWSGYRKYILPRQFLIGFTFYEENAPKGNLWNDVHPYDPKHPEKSKEIAGTHASKYVDWQPSSGLKGGMFCYALDRDGVGHPDKFGNAHPDINKIVKTDYSFSKALKAEMKKDKRYDFVDGADFKDPAILQTIREQVGIYRGDLERFDGELVLTNPAIKDLSGLTKLSRLSSLRLEGLTEVTRLTKDELPAHLKKSGNITLRNMTGLKYLKLKKVGLESLENLDVEHLTNLRKFDISHNKLDLSEEADGPLLQMMLERAKHNYVSAKNSDLAFEEQKPVGVLPKSYPDKEVRLSADGNEYNILERAVFGSETKRGTFIANESAFEEYKNKTIDGRRFVSPKWKYKHFKADYKNHKVTTFTSNLSEGNRWKLSTKRDESYRVHVSLDGKEVHQMTVHVGKGKTFMDNVAIGAKAVNAFNGLDVVINRAIDNDKTTVFASFSEANQIILDLGMHAQIRRLRLINAEEAGGIKRLGNTIDEATVLVPKDQSVDLAKMEYGARQAFIKDLANWEVVAEIEKGQLIEEKGSNVISRYCRLEIKKTKNHDTPYLAEFQILGWKLKGDVYGQAVKEELEARKAAKEFNYVDNAFEKRLAKLKKELQADVLDQETFDKVSAELLTEVQAFHQVARAKKAGFSVLEKYHALKNFIDPSRRPLPEDKLGNVEAIEVLEQEMTALNKQIEDKLGAEAFNEQLTTLVDTMKEKIQKLADLTGVKLTTDFDVDPNQPKRVTTTQTTTEQPTTTTSTVVTTTEQEQPVTTQQ